MKRQLKFRVWGVQDKCWCLAYPNELTCMKISDIDRYKKQPWVCMSLEGEVMFSDNMGAWVDDDQNNYVIQQFTGQKDKDGKEIYEGDILEVNILGDIYYRVVKWCETDASDDMGYDMVGFVRCWTDGPVKVVGNIFETPELLPENYED